MTLSKLIARLARNAHTPEWDVTTSWIGWIGGLFLSLSVIMAVAQLSFDVKYATLVLLTLSMVPLTTAYVRTRLRLHAVQRKAPSSGWPLTAGAPR
jgi:hypothetical protein